MRFHHIAYMVANTDETARSLASFAPVKIVDRKPLEVQNAYISVLGTAESGPFIELVEPFENNSAMRKRLEKNAGDATPYHICFSVRDFDSTLENLLAEGWLMVTRPFHGLLPGLRATHLYKRSAGMIEIIEDLAL